MQIRCKCHGMSGSCQLKTCWKSAPDFRIVGKVLKHMFRNAVLVDQSNMGNGEPIIQPNLSGRRRPPRKAMNQYRSKIALENTLFYYQRSPTFCERDPSADIQGEMHFKCDLREHFIWWGTITGTVGRKCNRTSTGTGSCSSMCCGRGYNMTKEYRVEKCYCRFLWCCQVECQECHTNEWISVCK